MPRTVLMAAMLLSLAMLPSTSFGAELTKAKFDQLQQELQPGDEPWRTIPWKIDLLDAQQAAAKERKPIFIWAMDGHPLGCT